MKRTEVVLNKTIKGEWHHSGKYDTLLVICHGFRSSRKNETLVAIERGLSAHGYETFLFTFSENEGGFDIKQQVDDIRHVLEHFKDYKQVILIGASFAALTTAIAAGQLNGVSGLVTVNGFFGKARLGKTYRSTYIKFRLASTIIPRYQKIYWYYKKRLRPSRIDVPVLVIYSKIDTEVFHSQSLWFYRCLRAPKQILELQKANHGISAERDQNKVVAAIYEWLQGLSF